MDTPPWIIIKYYNRFLDEAVPAYKIVSSPFSLSEKDISKEKALALIEKYDMHLAFSSRDGRVWELPGDPFYKVYAHSFATKQKRSEAKDEKPRVKVRERPQKKKGETAKRKQQRRKEEIEKRLNEMTWKLEKN